MANYEEAAQEFENAHGWRLSSRFCFSLSWLFGRSCNNDLRHTWAFQHAFPVPLLRREDLGRETCLEFSDM